MHTPLLEDLKTSLKSCVGNKRKSALIGKFVSDCVGLVHAAHDNLSGAKWTTFLEKQGAISKTVRGAPRVKETALSADIALEAQTLLKKSTQRQRVPSQVDWIPSDAISYVQADALSPSKAATGNSAKRPDLLFTPADPELELAFAVEAKVLEQSNDCDLLLGDEGIGCFTRSTDPYQTSGVIGLLGYSVQSDVAQHESALHNAMLKDTATGFRHVSRELRMCEWDSRSAPRRSILATTESAGLLCLSIVLGFPSIRQPKPVTAGKTATQAPSQSAAVNESKLDASTGPSPGAN